MEIYLPIAEMSVNIFLLLGLGVGVGFMSGMFGVGGGFLMTPLLIFIGIPPAVAVGSQANQILAASFSGGLVHMRRGTLDLKMGVVLTIGGVAGSGVGMWIFQILREAGQVDLLISIVYVVFLGVISSLMLVESLGEIIRRWRGIVVRRKAHRHTWVHGLPLKVCFRKSKLYTSVIPPLMIGVLVGILAAIMGVGGGFIMIPAMIYLLGMPTAVVIGTSLFQIVFVTAAVTMLHATGTQTVDVFLALIMLVGAVTGAQFGARVGGRLRGEELRTLLAFLVFGLSLRLAYGLVTEPADLFTLTAVVS